jgi:hypothetical protein
MGQILSSTQNEKLRKKRISINTRKMKEEATTILHSTVDLLPYKNLQSHQNGRFRRGILPVL